MKADLLSPKEDPLALIEPAVVDEQEETHHPNIQSNQTLFGR